MSVIQVGQVMKRKCDGCHLFEFIYNKMSMPVGWGKIQGRDYCGGCLEGEIQLELEVPA
jgi:hypothetical protein